MEEKTQESIERAAATTANTIVDVIDKLAGKQSDLRLNFINLEMDAGIFKATMNGAIILDVIMAKQEAPS